MGECLLEVLTVQGDKIVNVFWVQSCLILERLWGNLERIFRLWRTFGLQELQENVTTAQCRPCETLMWRTWDDRLFVALPPQTQDKFKVNVSVTPRKKSLKIINLNSDKKRTYIRDQVVFLHQCTNLAENITTKSVCQIGFDHVTQAVGEIVG